MSFFDEEEEEEEEEEDLVSLSFESLFLLEVVFELALVSLSEVLSVALAEALAVIGESVVVVVTVKRDFFSLGEDFTVVA